MLSLTWFMVVVSVSNTMTTLATGTVQLTILNCGNGVCDYPSETNANCPSDCYCGDGYCYSGYESCSDCPSDCGVCPVPPDEPSGPTPTPTPPVYPGLINETLKAKGDPTMHIFARFKSPSPGAEANMTQISCEVLEELLYDYEIPYRCFMVQTENLDEGNLLDSFVISKVGRDWIEEFNIDPDSIKVIRFYLNKRNTLPIGPIEEGDDRYWMEGYDSEFLYFLSSTSGFTGFFLTVGTPIAKPPVVEKPSPYCGDQICDATIGEGCMACPIDCGCPPGYICFNNDCVPECMLLGLDFGRFLGICWYWWVVMAAIASILAYLFWKRRRKPIWWILVILLSVAILVALVMVRVRHRKKSRWQRFLDHVKETLEALE